MSSKSAMILDPDTVIQCMDLGKCYQIYNNPKDRLKQAIWRGSRQYFREFWAVRDVNFEVKRGESLGIIGRNGSGKSTLLQLICGTLTPTEGTIQTKGRIAALLELGSGFNPEFTGIENVYLNASMLGLSKDETDKRLEDIVAFADIGDFIDQPVKNYSSGMAVRLAFAVIAHVDADILVVDEALAVGDAIFVQRCMRFIRRMREEKCLLFVSHDAEAMKSLCNHALWLSKGSTQAYGDCREVALDYLRYCQATSYGEEVTFLAIGDKTSNKKTDEAKTKARINKIQEDYFDAKTFDYEVLATSAENLDNGNGWKTGDAELLEVSIKSINNDETNSILRGGEKVEIRICAKANITLDAPILGFVLKDRLGQSLFGENTLIIKEASNAERVDPGDELTAVFHLWLPMLPTGEYTIMASIANGDLGSNIQHHWVENAIVLNIIASRVRYGLVGAFITYTDLAIRKI
jgi:lipopolysaccharide transport system ATP-binding protein